MTMNLSADQKKLWFTITALACLNGALIYYGVWPILAEIFALRATINAAETTIASLDQERTHFLNVERLVSKKANVFKRIEQTTLSLSAPLPFIELVESLAKEEGISAKLMVRDAPAGGYQNFQIVCEGDFPHVYQYLRLLELMPYQTVFSKFQLEFFEKGSTETAIKSKGESLRASKLPIIARLTIDIKVRAH